MANTGFKGLDIRQTGNQLVFRAFLQDSLGAIVTTGTTNAYIYELQSDGTLKSYDWNDNTFKTTALTTEVQALTHRTGNNSTTNTGIWTYSLSTLTGFTVGSIYLVRVRNTGAYPTDQFREFQYGSAEGDLKTTVGSTGEASLQIDILKCNGNSVAAGAIPNAAAGASGGILISGSNSGTTTLAALTVTGTLTVSDGIAVSRTTTNGIGISFAGNGTGEGLKVTAGASAAGVTIIGGSTSGNGVSVTTTLGDALSLLATGSTKAGIVATGGLNGPGAKIAGGSQGNGLNIAAGSVAGTGILITTQAGDGIQVSPTGGHGINIAANGTSAHGMLITGGTAGTSDGAKFVAGTGGVPIRGDLTGNITGSITSVTNAVSVSGQRFQKNTAFNAFSFTMIDSSDHVSPKPGLTITATRSIDGAAFASTANSPTAIANGAYKIDLSAADLNGNNIIFRFTATGADERQFTVVTEP